MHWMLDSWDESDPELRYPTSSVKPTYDVKYKQGLYYDKNLKNGL